MTAFALSPDRRDQLAELLDDEARFNLEFPGLADYLATAPGLPGTGNAEQDHVFDLRMLHFMTGGASANPYWDIVEPLITAGPDSRGGRREVNGGSDRGSGRLAYAQMALQAAYAYAIPSPGTLDWIAQVCDGRALTEVGAGRGYWAHQLSGRGLVVSAYDSAPPDSVENSSFPSSPGQPSVWHPVAGLDALEQARQSGEYGRSVLFLCWPPGWGDPMSTQVLAEYVEAGGDRLVYIGEPKGGKTGADEFFDALAAGWTLQSSDHSFVSWWNLSDVAQCWVRRT
ncbi:hypothetical protein ACFVAV_04875 [Nocardia sp. NPDC057663]|uniref:hypothetical protein n=1 Tax=Nocardia sp. NPDC057663 TaxID=3346201 RepID=UPI00366A932E